MFVAAIPSPATPALTGKPLARTAKDAKLHPGDLHGVDGAATIEQELLSGLPARTPVAIIQHASLPHQRHAITTLGRPAGHHYRAGAGQPLGDCGGDVVRGVARSRRNARSRTPGAPRD